MSSLLSPESNETTKKAKDEEVEEIIYNGNDIESGGDSRDDDGHATTSRNSSTISTEFIGNVRRPDDEMNEATDSRGGTYSSADAYNQQKQKHMIADNQFTGNDAWSISLRKIEPSKNGTQSIWNVIHETDSNENGPTTTRTIAATDNNINNNNNDKYENDKAEKYNDVELQEHEIFGNRDEDFVEDVMNDNDNENKNNDNNNNNNDNNVVERMITTTTTPLPSMVPPPPRDVDDDSENGSHLRTDRNENHFETNGYGLEGVTPNYSNGSVENVLRTAIQLDNDSSEMIQQQQELERNDDENDSTMSVDEHKVVVRGKQTSSPLSKAKTASSSSSSSSEMHPISLSTSESGQEQQQEQLHVGEQEDQVIVTFDQPTLQQQQRQRQQQHDAAEVSFQSRVKHRRINSTIGLLLFIIVGIVLGFMLSFRSIRPDEIINNIESGNTDADTNNNSNENENGGNGDDTVDTPTLAPS